jgi:hypothetical protein
MRKLFLLAGLACLAGTGYAANIFESLTGWTLGTNPLTMARAERHGTTDSVDVVQAGPGVSAATYKISDNGGEGNAVMWVWDSAVDCSEADNGHPNWGTKWGITNPLYQSMYACINRASYVARSKGYEVASTVSPYSVIWYHWTARPVDQQPGWHKWEFQVTFDAVSVVWNDNVTQTYDGTNETVGAFVGEGANGIFLQGDGAGGPETFQFDDFSGTGVFSGDTTAVAQPFTRNTWGTVKSLFR